MMGTEMMGAAQRAPQQEGGSERERIERTIAQRAATYAPAWRPREDHAEVGSVLALLFADMQTRIRRGIDRSGDKLQRELYNMYGASLRPALPARGYVCFDHAPGTDGVLVPEGTELTSTRVTEDGDTVPVTTTDDVFVSGLAPRAVCLTDGTEDRYRLLEAGEEGIRWDGVRPFAHIPSDLDAQQHVLNLYHPFLLEGSAACRIALTCADDAGVELLRRCRFFYDAKDGAVPFSVATGSAGAIVLSRDPEAAPPVRTEVDGRDMYRISIQAPFCEAATFLSGLSFGGFTPEQAPDHIFAQGSETTEGRFEPFGKRFSRFDEFTVSATDALSKRGALVTLRFDLQFGIGEVLETGPGIHWKLVMSKDDFPSDEPVPDMTIARVQWEYFNGRSWVGLRGTARYGGIFRPPVRYEDARPQQVELSFTCPADIEESLAEGFAIRARIAEITNEYRSDGRFIYPIVSHLRVSHRYEHGVAPEAADGLQNGCRVADARMPEGYLLSRPLPHRKRCLYLGFDAPIPDGGLQMLVVMRDAKRLRLPRVRVTCDTERGVEPLGCADRTDGFSKTGLIRLSHAPRQRATELFGHELFWVCFEDALDAYRDGSVDAPTITMVYPDATAAETLRHGISERLSVAEGEASPAFDLMYANVWAAQVWVSERDALTTEEAQELRDAGRLRPGEAEGRRWIRWEERPSLAGCSRDERVYVLDRSFGRLRFGNGFEGRVPAGDVENSVLVEYAVGGGSACCLAPGEVNGLSYAKPQIAAARNPLAFFGGLDAERVETALRRMAMELHAAGRGVSCEDLEFAARAVDPDLRAVRCFTGVDAAGEREPGAVTLVALPSYGSGDPGAFELFRERLLDALRGKLAVNAAAHLAVCPPFFVRMEARATVTVADERHAYRVRRDLTRALDRYLNEGAHEIGWLPTADDVLRVLMGVDAVISVRDLAVVFQTVAGAKTVELDYKAASKLPFAYATGGSYSFVIEAR